MSHKSDIEIAQEAQLLPIGEIASKLDIPDEALELYGKYKAKLDINKLPDTGRQGKVILVTAITPTPAGELGLLQHHENRKAKRH